jgi:hypothetical protein
MSIVMRTLRRGLPIAAVIGMVAPAYAHTREQFETTYQKVIALAVEQGVKPTRICYHDYCDNTMTIDVEGGDIVWVANIDRTNGLNSQEVRYTPNATPYGCAQLLKGRYSTNTLTGQDGMRRRRQPVILT